MAWGVACRSDSILHDPRNRQLLVYVRLIEVLQPSFVLLEQVLDILLKENGVYVKAMTANLVRMGYQAHTGTLITGAYGCPQVRPRCCRCRLWPRFSGSCGWHLWLAHMCVNVAFEHYWFCCREAGRTSWAPYGCGEDWADHTSVPVTAVVFAAALPAAVTAAVVPLPTAAAAAAEWMPRNLITCKRSIQSLIVGLGDPLGECRSPGPSRSRFNDPQTLPGFPESRHPTKPVHVPTHDLIAIHASGCNALYHALVLCHGSA